MGHTGPPSGPSCAASTGVENSIQERALPARRRVPRLLADAVADALEVGDAAAARAAAKALVAFVEELPRRQEGRSQSDALRDGEGADEKRGDR